MAKRADLVFWSSHTRAEGQVDLAGEAGGEANVTLGPASGSVTLGGGDPQAPGGIRVKNTATNASAETLGEFSVTNGAGRLQLWDQVNNRTREPTVTVDGNDKAPAIESQRSNATTATLDETPNGGRLELRGTGQSSAAMVAEATSGGGGQLRLRGSRGRVTCQAIGTDGALLLSGPPEPSDDKGGATTPGGGELLLREHPQQGEADIHLHVAGESDTDYGVGDDNRPRIFLDGPAATMELGRHQLGSERPAMNGRVFVRDDHGAKLLDLRATAGEDSEITLYWPGPDGPELRGKIAGHPRGLMIYDAGGRKALLLTESDEIETRRSVSRF